MKKSLWWRGLLIVIMILNLIECITFALGIKEPSRIGSAVDTFLIFLMFGFIFLDTFKEENQEDEE